MKLFPGISSYFPILLLCFVLISSCSKDSKTVTPIILEAQTSTSITTAATNQFLTIQANAAWQISVNYISGSGWITTSSSLGTGDANIILQFSQNTTTESRVAELVITSAGKEVKIPITQPAAIIVGGRETNPAWIEIPSSGNTADCATFTHEITVLGKTVRNYSMMYDKKEKIAYWVAYPHNSSYLGSTSRTDNWQPDPVISSTSQPDLFSGISGYDRGHQIPSADRTITNIANSQTFYFTNMTPQLSVLNGGIWANLENQVRNWTSSSDTLYVVTGAILKTVGGNELVNYATDSKGTRIAVPNYYYKVLLRLKNSKYDAIGFWFEHRSYGNVNATAAVTKTVRQIEALTGFNFFAILPKAIQDDVETTTTLSAWGL